MTITICIGSSCHLKGSREVVETLQREIAAHKLEDRINLTGAFCMGNCVNGVSVKLDGELFSVQPDTAQAFFDNEVMSRL
ncbi:MAG TPA: (2Fe-2S) ferredoxin domain-containing protein [Candidatus Aphodomorpha intestinavium]|uniref:(2Fe-2S) ferredoxin domain-containing protein n=1 Tax=Candidatus Aphodomorpha intestinavium TaxID=2840672 RepID=A0A9D1SSZ5_9FIRM|nr:(2Fe-2S) ferredoxin domain-containing protein [Candidatus Aphodomorpha intestinavium]